VLHVMNESLYASGTFSLYRLFYTTYISLKLDELKNRIFLVSSVTLTDARCPSRSNFEVLADVVPSTMNGSRGRIRASGSKTFEDVIPKGSTERKLLLPRPSNSIGTVFCVFAAPTISYRCNYDL